MTVRRTPEGGFSLIEVLFTAAGFVVLTVGLVALFSGFVQGANGQATQHAASDAAWRIVAQLERDAETSLAIFIPASDVLGNGNADGHEVDFYTKDATHAPVFAAYRFDGSAITRYTYPAPGTPAAASGTATAASGFAATTLLASSLASDPSVSPLLGGYTPQDVSLQVGYAGVSAGNALVSVNVITTAKNLTVRLLPGALPSSFTVQGTYTPTPAPGGLDAAGNTYAQESTCAKPNGFDFSTGTPPTEVDTFNVRPTGCPTPTPAPHVTFGEFDCQTAPGAFINTDYSVSPPIDYVNYSGALFTATCLNGAAATPPAGTPNQVAFVQNCSQPQGVIGVNNTTVPPTSQYNRTDGCTNAPAAANSIYDWQYESTSPGCLFNASASMPSGCAVTARLIRSDDNGLFWFPLNCIYTGTYNSGAQAYTYIAQSANQSGCIGTQFSQLPLLYLNAGDPRV